MEVVTNKIQISKNTLACVCKASIDLAIQEERRERQRRGVRRVRRVQSSGQSTWTDLERSVCVGGGRSSEPSVATAHTTTTTAVASTTHSVHLVLCNTEIHTHRHTHSSLAFADSTLFHPPSSQQSVPVDTPNSAIHAEYYRLACCSIGNAVPCQCAPLSASTRINAVSVRVLCDIIIRTVDCVIVSQCTNFVWFFPTRRTKTVHWWHITGVLVHPNIASVLLHCSNA